MVLHNTLPEATSIVFPGQKGVKADGNPAQPQFDAGGSLTSLVQPAAGARHGSVTYTFTAGSPGTYLYESGTDVNKQLQMGLYGALVVRPAGHAGPGQRPRRLGVQPRATSTSSCSRRSTPTCTWPSSAAEPVDWTAYNARYFMINGRSMPDTLAPNNASWLPSQPYGALVHIQPYDAATNPLPAVIRYLNAGTVNYPFHPHGSDERVVNKDGHAAAGTDRPGPVVPEVRPRRAARARRVDALMDWRDVEHWNAADQPDPRPRSRRSPTSSSVGTDTWFSESPYLGTQERAARRRSRRTTSAASTTTSPTATRSSRPPTTERPSAA